MNKTIDRPTLERNILLIACKVLAGNSVDSVDYITT